MRGAYLRKRSEDRAHGSRGGVGVSYERHDEYELEIGQDQNASPEMLALCAHIDEITEFLELSSSHIAKMILASWKRETKRLLDQWAE